jgi:integrase
MAWIRREPSGNWAATVYTPAGRRRRTFRLEGQAEAWARKQEQSVADADWIDPKAGQVTVGQIWDRYADGRRLASASRKRDASHWKVHVAPRWAAVPCGTILKPDITGWVTEMERAGIGAASIEAAVGVLRAMLEIAVDARLIRANPAAKVKPPRRPAHLDRILDDEEEEPLLSAFSAAPNGRLFVEVLLYCGLRWEEAAALDREHVDTRQRLLHIGPVLERDGTIRPFPKSPAGARPVPVDDELWPRMRERLLAVPVGGLLFTTAEGRPLHYPNWRSRVWVPALRAAGLADPQPTPHDLRHTYGTRLAEDGVPPHEIMALMGHANLQSVQRYLHAREGRFDRARRAMHRARRLS